MRNFLKFILFFVISLSKKNRFVILNPNLTFLRFNKAYVFDKKSRSVSCYIIRNQYDYITLQELFYYECYKIDDLNIFNKGIKNNLKKNLLIIDCGSNIGCSTNYFLDNFKEAHVVSIEPDEHNFNLLSKNVNNERALLLNNAVSSENVSYKILNSIDNRAISIIKDRKENIKKAVTINQILEDSKYKNFEPFLIKIDIEGHENTLFEGNIEWFQKFKIVIIEIHDWMLPGKSISKNYFTTLAKSMQIDDRDIIIRGENLICFKNK